MRPIGILLVALVALAQPAAAQAPDRVGPPPPVKPRAVARPAPAPAPPPTVRPTQSFASGGIVGALNGFQPLRPFPPLVGLPPTGDPAPQCRVACAKVHNNCVGEDTCDANWTQCIRGCATGR